MSSKTQDCSSAAFVALPFPSAKDQDPDEQLAKAWNKLRELRPTSFESSLQMEEYMKSCNSWQRDTCFGVLHVAASEPLAKKVVCEKILPGIIDLALRLPSLVTSHLETLKSGDNKTVALQKTLIASLLANAFLCTFPHRVDRSPENAFRNFPSINLSSLYSLESRDINNMKKEKIKCLFQFFSRMVTVPDVEGTVKFTRVYLSPEMKPNWAESQRPIKAFEMQALDANMEEAKCIQVCFANKEIGGSVLSDGCTQEGIKFITCPELIVARLITERLADDEALVIQGVKKYCNYQGYQTSFKYLGGFRDDRDDASERILVAIDATDFSQQQPTPGLVGMFAYQARRINLLPKGMLEDQYDAYLRSTGLSQYTEKAIQRELNKAYAGFKCEIEGISPALPVGTGNWGSGYCKGDPILKAKIQHLAATAAGRPLLYFPFNDTDLRETLLVESAKFNGKTVAEVYRELLLYAQRKIDAQLQE